MVFHFLFRPEKIDFKKYITIENGSFLLAFGMLLNASYLTVITDFDQTAEDFNGKKYFYEEKVYGLYFFISLLHLEEYTFCW